LKILAILFFAVGAFADDLPLVDQVLSLPVAPEKIQPTGKRETIEPVVDGKVHGEGRYYHPNGQRYGSIPWRNGKKHGAFKLYREDGSLEQYLEYEDGQPHGLVIWMHPDSSIQLFSEYKNGNTAGTIPCVSSVFLKDLENNSAGLKQALMEKCIPAKKTEARPSFDCSKAYTKAEKAICSSPQLGGMDRLLSERYYTLLDGLSRKERKKLRSDQREWLFVREACLKGNPTKEESDVCILEAMKKRIKDLETQAKENSKDSK
jgi:uncharacterized protein YecT (DUF1311 family)